MEELNNKPINTNVDSSEDAGLSLTDLLRAARAKWMWFVVSIAICLGIGALYLTKATPMYTRSTEILLKDDPSQSFTTDLSMIGFNSISPMLLNEMFIMTSPEIMEQTVIELNLNETYKYSKLLRKAEYYKNSPIVVGAIDSLTNKGVGYSFKVKLNDDSTSVTLSKFKQAGKKFNGSVKGSYGEPIQTPIGVFIIEPTKFYAEPAKKIGPQNEILYSYTPVKGCARTYCKRVSSAYDEERGNIVTLTISLPNAQKATDVLKTMVNTYNNRWVNDKNQIAIATSKFIDERLAGIEKELGEVESKITAFKSSHKMTDMETMGNIYLSQASENQKALNELSQEIAIAQYIKQELAINDITRMLPTADIAGTNLQQMISTYNTKVGERNAKLQTLPEESPLIQQKTEAITNARAAILASVDAALTALNKRHDAILDMDRKTQQQLAAAPSQAEYLMSEERNRKVKEELYVYLLQRREEIELNQAFTVYNTRMVTEPYGSDIPSSPNTKMVLLLALVMGVIIPTLIIYVQEVSNTTVRSRKEIEDLPVPFLGEVPRANVPQHRSFPLIGGIRPASPNPERKILVNGTTNDIINESFRMVRTNIDFMSAMDHRKDLKIGKTLMTVSLNSGSGKTFVSLNAAAIFAIKGKKVCLVDMDLRKGTVSLNVGSPARGLTDYLIGKTDNIDELVVRNINGIEGLDILPEGIKPPNPTELLYSPRLEELVTKLRNKYDYIIFDCPPIEIVADARLLNPFIDMTIFVMRSGLFEKKDLKTLTQIYTARRYNNMALILNATDSVHGVYGAYGYGYGYAYGTTSKKRRRRK